MYCVCVCMYFFSVWLQSGGGGDGVVITVVYLFIIKDTECIKLTTPMPSRAKIAVPKNKGNCWKVEKYFRSEMAGMSEKM